jgi:hypothetical protein
MRAAATPINVLDCDEGFVDAATGPTTSTCSDASFGARAVLTKVVASLLVTFFASTEKLTVANAILPFLLT